ncbi:iron ABC transporter permease [Ruegeria sp. 2012CJ41-6]|uniref:Iron ABC transporter permease n=1 Tax=Ruegeria spongiae TaxID=2942209 RepID=A0ABT0Q822_9RHOB|nr:iron ABC transporter permease [Ruegeria spongiae]MCL6285960.1 iron ABC transporter permease [Ruegeria spongiae]
MKRLRKSQRPCIRIYSELLGFGVKLSFGAIILIALILLSVLYGTTNIPLNEVATALARGFGWSKAELAPAHRIIFELRFPRALFAAIIGAGLGVVGVVLQTTTRNDLADPFLFGLSSGAAAGTVFVITVTGDVLGTWTLPLAAFIGGIIASAIVLALVHSLGSSAPEKLILAGLAVSFLFGALTNYLIFAGDNRAAHSVVFWMLGGLGLSRWASLPIVFAGLFLIASFAFYRRRWLDALLAGDAAATSLGVPVTRLRMLMFLIAALSTATFVSVAGVIGFVGLMVPHLARGLVGTLHTRLLPTAAIVGACLLTSSDIVARLVLAPQEIPVGIVTTSIGAGFVFVLLIGSDRRRRVP